LNVLIPAYKPDERLLVLVRRLHEETDFRIIVVNDGSGREFDNVFCALPDYCILLAHDVNRGKGCAMKTGFRHILDHFPGSGGVVVVDADGQHLLEDIQNVCRESAAHPDSLIIGTRRFTGKVPFRSRFGNTLTKYVFALASGVKLSDTQTGLRVIPLGVLPLMISLAGERYEYEMNMLLKAAEAGIPMREVFIETVYLDNNKSSHFHVVRDSIKIYGVIFKFALASLASFLLDYGLFNLLYYTLLASVNSQAMRMLWSVVGARVISSLFNYVLNKKLVFKNRQNTGATLLKYYLLVGFIMGCNYGLMLLLVNLLGMAAPIAKIVVDVLLFIASYLVQRKLVFQAGAAGYPTA